MKYLLIILVVVSLIGVFAYSLRCALKDGYIKHRPDNEYSTWWEWFGGDPLSIMGGGSSGISKLEIPFALIRYWAGGKQRMKKHREFYNEHIAGKTIEEANAMLGRTLITPNNQLSQ